MPGYANYGPLDDAVRTTGDTSFVGMNSYLEAETLSPGFVSASKDMRFDGDRATVRSGIDFLAGTVTLTYAAGTEQVFASGVYSDPDDGNENWLVAATKAKAIIWNKDTANGLNVSYYSATIAHTAVDTSAETITISAHKFQVGDTVQVSTTDTIPAGLAINTTYYAIDASANTIKLATTLANALAGTAINITSQGAGNHTIQEVVVSAQNPMVVQAFNKVYIMRLGSRPLAWDGATAATGQAVTTKFEALSSSASGAGDPLPSSDFGIYFRNRMIVSQPPTVATPTTSKTGAQIIVASDLLTENNVTPTTSEFYLNFGSADWFVGAIDYQENQLLVFMRHSVHMITNMHDTSISAHYEVTGEFGCIARGTIARSGPQTYFLSDRGVYVVSPGVDPGKGMGITISKVSGEALPLSAPIQGDFDDVNMLESAVSKSSAIVHNNKYLIAVPTGSDTTCKTVFVYDILSGGSGAWVSRDEIATEITDWAIMPYGSNPQLMRLFMVGPTGWYLYEQNLGLDDTGREIGSSSESGTAAIAAQMVTRSYSFADLEVKRWKRGQLGVSVINNDAFTIKVSTADPDLTPTTVLTYSASGTEEALLRFGIRQRGYSCAVTVDVTAGSPAFRHVSVDATGNTLNAQREVA